MTSRATSWPTQPASTTGGGVRGPGRRLAWGAAALVALLLAFVAGTAAGGTSSPTVHLDPAATNAPAGSSPEPSVTAPGSSSATPTPTATASSRPTPSATPSPSAGSALALLAALPVKGRAPRTGYDRALFGQTWADVDRNGCDTRNDVLRRDLRRFTLKAGTHGCVVLSGTLTSPYTGRTRSFVRGQGTSSTVQIDHVVALSDAWQKGAQRLDAATRTALANDPLNLLAVEGAVNQAKGDGDAATWLPPLKSSRCDYVARQVAVKAKYHLWVTAAERDAIARVLASCRSEKPPVAGPIRLGGGTVASPRPTSTPKPRTTTPAPTVLDPRFGTCREAIAHGYGPYRQGVDPEYDWYRDADHDGIDCER